MTTAGPARGPLPTTAGPGDQASYGEFDEASWALWTNSFARPVPREAAGLYFLALHGALTLPDICGALESDTGTASGAKYKAWLRANVPGLASDAELIYGLRCSLLLRSDLLNTVGRKRFELLTPRPPVWRGRAE